MDRIVKCDKNDKPLEVTDADIEDIDYWESIAKDVVEGALKELHDKKISSPHGDRRGIYEISLEGKKMYISEH